MQNCKWTFSICELSPDLKSGFAYTPQTSLHMSKLVRSSCQKLYFQGMGTIILYMCVFLDQKERGGRSLSTGEAAIVKLPVEEISVPR